MRKLLVACALAVLAACSRVTQENFAKVQEGMNEREVIAILGEPTESNSVNVLGISGTTSRWGSIKRAPAGALFRSRYAG